MRNQVPKTEKSSICLNSYGHDISYSFTLFTQQILVTSNTQL